MHIHNIDYNRYISSISSISNNLSSLYHQKPTIPFLNLVHPTAGDSIRPGWIHCKSPAPWGVPRNSPGPSEAGPRWPGPGCLAVSSFVDLPRYRSFQLLGTWILKVGWVVLLRLKNIEDCFMLKILETWILWPKRWKNMKTVDDLGVCDSC